MLKTTIVLPDGTEISSGAGTANAVQSCTYTECVNSGTELTLGSVCANMIELKLITPGGGLSVAAGDELVVYRQEGDSPRQKIGIFIAEKPTRPTANTMKLTAYDRVSLLDKDLTSWLASLNGWPYTLYDLANMICAECGLTLTNDEIPNGSFLAQAFAAEGITGRQLMQWIGEASGRFCRATADGLIEFAWYTPVEGHSIGTTPAYTFAELAVTYDATTATVTVDAPVAATYEDETVITNGLDADTDYLGTVVVNGTVEHQRHFYFQGGLTFEDYTVAAIEKVKIQGSGEDVGVIWPNDTDATNTYRVTGNMLLSSVDPDALQTVAATLYEQLKNVTYTPCELAIPANLDIRAGHSVSVTDRNGNTITAYIMTRKQTGQKDTLECTGSHRRDSVTAVNEQSFRELSGKVLNLRTDVEGIRAENKAADGRLAALALTVDGINSRVEQQNVSAQNLRTDLTAVQQTAESLRISVQSIQDNGASKVKTDASYTFDDNGLKISRSGEQMENLLDNTGMYVTRGGETILQANNDGVIATDVRVRNYLCIGENSRLEDYETGRTACFYVGG